MVHFKFCLRQAPAPLLLLLIKFHSVITKTYMGTINKINSYTGIKSDIKALPELLDIQSMWANPSSVLLRSSPSL